MKLKDLIGALQEQIDDGGVSPDAEVVVAHMPPAGSDPQLYEVFGSVTNLWNFSGEKDIVRIDISETEDEPLRCTCGHPIDQHTAEWGASYCCVGGCSCKRLAVF